MTPLQVALLTTAVVLVALLVGSFGALAVGPALTAALLLGIGYDQAHAWANRRNR